MSSLIHEDPPNRYAAILRLAKAQGKAKPRRRVPRGPSTLELELRGQVLCAGLTKGIEVEYVALPERKFRWDLAWPSHRLLVEIQGGIWGKGGHSTGDGITRDCLKNNLAVLAGFRCLMVTAEHIKSGQALKWIQEALGHCI